MVLHATLAIHGLYAHHARNTVKSFTVETSDTERKDVCRNIEVIRILILKAVESLRHSQAVWRLEFVLQKRKVFVLQLCFGVCSQHH